MSEQETVETMVDHPLFDTAKTACETVTSLCIGKICTSRTMQVPYALNECYNGLIQANQRIAALESELAETKRECEGLRYERDALVVEEARLISLRDQARAERDKLQEIVDRLPKTGNGVPVCPGDADLWGVNAEGEIVEHCVAPHYLMTEGGEYEAWHIVVRGGDLHDQLIPSHEAFSDETWYGNVGGLYSTREAAEQAIAARVATEGGV